MIRGIERRAIFKGDTDRQDFVERLGHNLLASFTACYAWALMTNHVHLLLRTGIVPLSTLMRRVLTGYAMAFNRRHRRSGHLFQNRYKSILCQEETYLLELTRYIHLNPLRAKIVPDLKGLDSYAYTGHGVLLGNHEVVWQDTGKILTRFGEQLANSRKRYRSFVEKGIGAGRRPDLVGGGLMRSLGGWQAAKKLLKGSQRIKSDERILGDSDFVLQVLDKANEQLDHRHTLAAKGIDLDTLAQHVAKLFDLAPDRLLDVGRYPEVVKARSLLCYWAVRELEMTATSLARRIGLTQPAISIAVKRGEALAREKGYDIMRIVS